MDLKKKAAPIFKSINKNTTSSYKPYDTQADARTTYEFFVDNESKYPKTFEQYYSKPFDSAPTTPKGDTVIYTTKDYGLSQEPITKMNWYAKFFPQHEAKALKELV